MKKLISLILILVMVMGLSVTVFAAETDVGTGDYTTDVTGTYVEETIGDGIVYSVDIAWEGMSFTYHSEKAPVWNATEHKYSPKKPAYWEGEGTIAVTNHSNTKISAVPKFDAANGYDTAEMNFSTDKLRVTSADKNNSAQTGSITVTPGGSLPKMDASATIGTITVTIAQDTDVTVEEAESLIGDASVLEHMGKYVNPEYYENYQADFNVLAALKGELESATLDFKAGTSSQEELNVAYDGLLRSYNDLKEKTGL